MKATVLNMPHIDAILYWACIAAALIGVMTCKLGRMDAIALSGIFFACLLLKPLASNGR